MSPQRLSRAQASASLSTLDPETLGFTSHQAQPKAASPILSRLCPELDSFRRQLWGESSFTMPNLGMMEVCCSGVFYLRDYFVSGCMVACTSFCIIFKSFMQRLYLLSNALPATTTSVYSQELKTHVSPQHGQEKNSAVGGRALQPHAKVMMTMVAVISWDCGMGLTKKMYKFESDVSTQSCLSQLVAVASSSLCQNIRNRDMFSPIVIMAISIQSARNDLSLH